MKSPGKQIEENQKEIATSILESIDDGSSYPGATSFQIGRTCEIVRLSEYSIYKATLETDKVESRKDKDPTTARFDSIPLPNYAFTLGLDQLGLPEALVMGLPHEKAVKILQKFVTLMQREKEPPPAYVPLMGVFTKYPFAYAPIGQETAFAYMPESGLTKQGAFVAGQLFWTDEYGHFPWEQGYNRGHMQFCLSDRGWS